MGTITVTLSTRISQNSCNFSNLTICKGLIHLTWRKKKNFKELLPLSDFDLGGMNGNYKMGLSPRWIKEKNITLYISFYLFGLISYFTRVLCNLVSNISDDNSSITHGWRPSQMCINCMSKDTIFIHIFALLINSVKLTTSSPFLSYVCEKRVYRRQDNFGAKMRFQNESSAPSPWGRQWVTEEPG